MNEVTTTSTAMPADYAEKLMKGIAESRSTTPAGMGGKPLLRLLKDGIWVYGQENIEVEPLSRWAINPTQLVHGWVCWKNADKAGQKNELKGELMVPMTQAKPPQPAPVDGAGFASQLGCDLKCISGEDEGVEVHYKNGSDGGLKWMDGIRLAIQLRLSQPDGLNYPCPVLTLEQTHYPHPQWGKTYKPVLNIVGWCSMDGTMQDPTAFAPVAPALPAQAPPPPEPAPAPTARVRARSPRNPAPAAAPVKPAEKPVEPVAAPVAPTGQRRRPVAR